MYYRYLLLTQATLDPSFFQDKAVMVYKFLISLSLGSSHICLLGLQFKTRSLRKANVSIVNYVCERIHYISSNIINKQCF